MKQIYRTIFISCIIGFALPAFAAEQPTTDVGTLDEASAKQAFPAKPPYSPYAGRNFPTRPFFGDTHLHTSFSMDAGAFGCRLTPRDAYRFAKGEEVTASSGQRVKLSRPLDFMVVSDHSDDFQTLLFVVVLWLVMIFLGFSLIAPPNATTNLVLLASALCAAGAIF